MVPFSIIFVGEFCVTIYNEVQYVTLSKIAALAATHVMAGPTGHLSVSAADDDINAQVANIGSGTDVAL